MTLCSLGRTGPNSAFWCNILNGVIRPGDAYHHFNRKNENTYSRETYNCSKNDSKSEQHST